MNTACIELREDDVIPLEDAVVSVVLVFELPEVGDSQTAFLVRGKLLLDNSKSFANIAQPCKRYSQENLTCANRMTHYILARAKLGWSIQKESKAAIEREKLYDFCMQTALCLVKKKT